MKNFDLAFEQTHGREGGYVNDPDDPGGETKYGITKRQYPNEDIFHLTVERAKELAKRDYWDKMALDLIEDDDVAAEIYDTGFNCGPGTAVRIAQRSANALNQTSVEVDGMMGPISVAAINLACQRSKKVLLTTLNGLQVAYYVALVEKREQSKKFFRGWVLNRVMI